MLLWCRGTTWGHTASSHCCHVESRLLLAVVRDKQQPCWRWADFCQYSSFFFCVLLLLVNLSFAYYLFIINVLCISSETSGLAFRNAKTLHLQRLNVCPVYLPTQTFYEVKLQVWFWAFLGICALDIKGLQMSFCSIYLAYFHFKPGGRADFYIEGWQEQHSKVFLKFRCLLAENWLKKWLPLQRGSFSLP